MTKLQAKIRLFQSLMRNALAQIIFNNTKMITQLKLE